MGRIHLVAAGFALAAAAATAEPTVAPGGVRRSLVSDPAVRSGVLPNGMRYFIRKASRPAHGLSVRFMINAGSFEEEENERGYAHLVEHMAFRSTRSAPQGGIDRRFAAFGAAFGRDQNGYTRLYSTSYKLDFANASEDTAAAAFAWVRDVADGVIFTDAGVTTERGVVLAEKEANDTPATAARETVAQFQLPLTRATRRDPAGERVTLAGATPVALGRYYTRWYRPDNAELIVVGDRSLNDMEARIVATFGSWHSAEPAPARPAVVSPDVTRGAAALQLTTPALPTAVSACRFRSVEQREDEVARLQRDSVDGIWTGVLSARYQALVNAGGSGMLGAVVGVINNEREYASTCLTVVPAGDAWEKPLASAQGELRRFAAEGPTEQELQEQIEDARAALRGAITADASRTSDVIADQMLARALDRRPIIAPREAMHAFDVAVEELDPETVRKRFAESWSGAGPIIAALTPSAIPAGAVLASWRRNDSATALARYTDRKHVVWTYPPSATLGTVVSREVIANPGFTRIRYANGLILNFKQLDSEKNHVTITARFGSGRGELPDAAVIGASLGTELFGEGGLGKLSAEEISASLAPAGWRFRFGIGADAFQWSDSILTSNLATELQVFAAFFADPGFRPALDERIGPAIDLMYRAYASQPEMTLSDAFGKTLDPANPGNLPPRATFAALRSADFARLLGPVVREAPIELTVVGDIHQAEAERMVATTLGALPPRRSAERPPTNPHFFRYPDRPVPTIKATHQGPADRAVAELAWPLYVATPERRREERALSLVAAIFNQALRDRVRVTLGKTYSPEVVTAMPDHADQGSLIAALQANPADIDALIAETAGVGRAMALGSFDQTLLDTARRPILAALATRRTTNDWWAAALSGSARNPATVADVMGEEAMIAGITLDEVRIAARQWLSRAPFVAVVVPARPERSGTSPAVLTTRKSH